MSRLKHVSPIFYRARSGDASSPQCDSDAPVAYFQSKGKPARSSATGASPPQFATLAVLAWICLVIVPLTAQPLNPTTTTNNAATTNLSAPELVTTATTTNFSMPTKLERFNFVLSTAKFQANTRDYASAERNFIKLLAEDVPEATQQAALFELGQVVRMENDLPRAQAIYTQYLQRWPGDSRTPDVYLHQGQIFRQMGLPNLALAKFYGVMTTALSLKNNQLPYYKGLVLQAQVEIAETHYLVGKFKDAADYYARLLTQNDPALDRAQIQFRLIRSLEAINRHEDAANQAQDFLAHFPESTEEPEVRYHLAQAFKGQNRNIEALQQVKIFLKEEREKTTNNPAIWSYWQQRVGNEIGNELYQEGDYVKALQVYLALAQLDPAPAWQLPVRYQVGITYEKLLQPGLAIEAYRNILTNAAPLAATNLSPSLKAVVDMAHWRLNFLEWNVRAESFNQLTAATAINTNLNLSQQ
jgi:tetratricopeptide (TPR) repeat protein